MTPDGRASGVEFRRFDPARDAPADLHALHERALRDAGTDPDDVPGTDDLDRVAETYLDGGAFLVGEDDGTVVAMGGFRPARDLPPGGREGFADAGGAHRGAAAELSRIAVAPDAQGRGLGTELLAELERLAVDAGYEWAVLTTAARQRAGVEFYRSRGYREVDRMQMEAYELLRFEKRIEPER